MLRLYEGVTHDTNDAAPKWGWNWHPVPVGTAANLANNFKIGLGRALLLALQSHYWRRFTISCCRNGSRSRPNTYVLQLFIIFILWRCKNNRFLINLGLWCTNGRFFDMNGFAAATSQASIRRRTIEVLTETGCTDVPYVYVPSMSSFLLFEKRSFSSDSRNGGISGACEAIRKNW